LYFISVVSQLLSPEAYFYLAALVTTSIIMSHIIWALERGYKQDFPRAYVQGIPEAVLVMLRVR
jgi:hypothetical protein